MILWLTLDMNGLFILWRWATRRKDISTGWRKSRLRANGERVKQKNPKKVGGFGERLFFWAVRYQSGFAAHSREMIETCAVRKSFILDY